MADTTLPIAIIAGLLAGGAGAAATTIFMAPTAPDSSVSEIADASTLENLRSANSTLTKKLEEQERRLQDLEGEIMLASIPSNAGGATRTPAYEESNDYITRADLDEALKELAAKDLAVVNPAARQTIEAVLEQRDEERRAEREAERNAQREKFVEDRLAQMQSELGLDNRQLGQMRDAMATAEQRMRDMWSNPEGRPEGREGMREAFQKLRDDSRTEIQGFLTPAQYEQYVEKGYDNPFGGGRGGMGGGRGGDGGFGNAGGGRGGRGGF